MLPYISPVQMSPEVFFGEQFSRTKGVYVEAKIPLSYAPSFWSTAHVNILKKLKKGKSWIRN